MDIAVAERMKREWTGKRVTVAPSQSSLRRFAGRTGTVVTVNMNGNLLIRFDGSADIGWYDVPAEQVCVCADPTPLQEKAPLPPGEPPVTSTTPPSPGATSNGGLVPTGNAAKTRPKSILELARRQGAAKPDSK